MLKYLLSFCFVLIATQAQAIVNGTDQYHGIIARTTVAIGNAQGYYCTGVILAPDIILTAAHCTEDTSSAMFVYFGVDVRNVSLVESRQVVALLRNPRWAHVSNHEFNTGDYAVLKIAGQVPRTHFPVTVMPSYFQLWASQPVILAGYGSTGYNDVASGPAGILRHVIVPIQDPHFSTTEILVDQSMKKGSCHGDSGGPAFVQGADGGFYLFGLTSRGDSNCILTGIYSALHPVWSWVEEAVQRLRSAYQ